VGGERRWGKCKQIIPYSQDVSLPQECEPFPAFVGGALGKRSHCALAVLIKERGPNVGEGVIGINASNVISELRKVR
jgi:hypothetical protein